MDGRDLLVTPILILLIYLVGYLVRPMVSDSINRKYFFPALSIKLFGAIAVGLIYTFYYEGGDTFVYHTRGSRIVWEAFYDSFDKGLKLIFSDREDQSSIYKYSSQIYFFKDQASYFVVRVAAIFDLLTFSTYSATACLFAVLGFAGGWMMFLTFYRRYADIVKWLAYATLFIPSVAFWGSGIFKDTITLACLGFITFSVDKIFIQRKFSIRSVLLLLVSFYCVFIIRKFMLQAFVPALFVWIYYSRLISIRSLALKLFVFPAAMCIILFFSYYSFVKIGEGDVRYSADRIAETTRITSYYIAYQSGPVGSMYVLGDLDGSFGSMLVLAPQAINVSLFRPYLWEVRNPLMLLSSIESLTFLLLTIYILWARREKFLNALRNQDVIFLLAFSISFAFAVGINSNNFGTLSRYKIALMPYFALALALILQPDKASKEQLEFNGITPKNFQN